MSARRTRLLGSEAVAAGTRAFHFSRPRRLLLLYADHRPEDAAWLEELQALERGWPDFRLLPVHDRMNRSSQSWSGLAGRGFPRLLSGRPVGRVRSGRADRLQSGARRESGFSLR